MQLLGGFALRFFLVFALLAAPWPRLQSAVGVVFRAEARLLVTLVFPHQSIDIRKYSDPHHRYLDSLIVLPGQKNSNPTAAPSSIGIPIDSVSQAWIPLAMLIALTLATPVPWPKRGQALLAGALGLQLLFALTICVSICAALTTETTHIWLRYSLLLANHLLFENVWFSFVPPFLLWGVWLACTGHYKPLAARLTQRPMSTIR